MSNPAMLPLDRWPLADRAFWDALFLDGGPFGETGRGCGWSAPTIRRFQYCHRRWLGFLGWSDPAALALAPHERLTRERVRQCRASLKAGGLKPASIASVFDGLLQLHVAFDPAATPDWLRRFVRTERSEAHAATSRPDFRIAIDTIWHGTLAALKSQDASANTDDIQTAMVYRDRLILAMLTFTPLRRKNLAAIELGTTLTQMEDGWQLKIVAAEAKTPHDIVRLLPPALGKYLDVYLARFRPSLLRGRVSDRLWISILGSPLCPDGVADAVSRVTVDLFDIRLTPHDLRRIAATTIATDAPEKIYLATQILGHTTRAITELHYNRASSLTAGRRHADALDDLRQSLNREIEDMQR
jgi:integrase